MPTNAPDWRGKLPFPSTGASLLSMAQSWRRLAHMRETRDARYAAASLADESVLGRVVVATAELAVP
jgi:hypothetical protein